MKTILSLVRGHKGIGCSRTNHNHLRSTHIFLIHLFHQIPSEYPLHLTTVRPAHWRRLTPKEVQALPTTLADVAREKNSAKSSTKWGEAQTSVLVYEWKEKIEKIESARVKAVNKAGPQNPLNGARLHFDRSYIPGDLKTREGTGTNCQRKSISRLKQFNIFWNIFRISLS